VSKGLKTSIVILAVLVVLGLVTMRGLRQTVQRLRSAPKTDEQARREVMQEPISTPTDVNVQAEMYWLSAASPTSLEPTAIQLPLSADPVERSKQLLNALIARAPDPTRRTLPAEASLLAFYILPGGTGVADFSDEISSAMPSGILSEQLAVQSIAQTLGANGTGIRQLKILVHGQEADTLAGHLDLYGVFPVQSPVAGAATGTAAGSTTDSATASPAATPAASEIPVAAPLTAPTTPIAPTPKAVSPVPAAPVKQSSN
jgi:hypothetical protein